MIVFGQRHRQRKRQHLLVVDPFHGGFDGHRRPAGRVDRATAGDVFPTGRQRVDGLDHAQPRHEGQRIDVPTHRLAFAGEFAIGLFAQVVGLGDKVVGHRADRVGRVDELVVVRNHFVGRFGPDRRQRRAGEDVGAGEVVAVKTRLVGGVVRGSNQAVPDLVAFVGVGHELLVDLAVVVIVDVDRRVVLGRGHIDRVAFVVDVVREVFQTNRHEILVAQQAVDRPSGIGADVVGVTDAQRVEDRPVAQRQRPQAHAHVARRVDAEQIRDRQCRAARQRTHDGADAVVDLHVDDLGVRVVNVKLTVGWQRREVIVAQQRVGQSDEEIRSHRAADDAGGGVD